MHSEPEEALEVDEAPRKQKAPLVRVRDNRVPGSPQCPYCSGQMGTYAGIHPICVAMAFQTFIAGIALMFLYGAVGLAALLGGLFWLLPTQWRVYCEECGLDVK